MRIFPLTALTRKNIIENFGPGGLRFVAGRSRILDLTNETCDGVQILDQILEVRLEDFAHRPSTTSRA
jgi:hypothetical protein